VPPARRPRAAIRICLGLAAAVVLASPALALDFNSFRRANGLPGVSQSAALSRLARSHAADLARRQSLDHDGFAARINTVSWSTAAENVLYGCASASCAFTVWAKSSEHRANMMLPAVTQYGLASAKASNGQVYWVLEMIGGGGRPTHKTRHKRVRASTAQ
jgi:hypothetical protein